jgi:hypothetical protein
VTKRPKYLIMKQNFYKISLMHQISFLHFL